MENSPVDSAAHSLLNLAQFGPDITNNNSNPSNDSASVAASSDQNAKVAAIAATSEASQNPRLRKNERAKDLATAVVEDDWKWMDRPQKLNILEGSVLQPNVPRHPIDIFSRIYTDDLFEKLACIANRNLEKIIDVKRLPKKTNAKEIRLFYACQMLIESTCGNDLKDLRTHYGAIFSRYQIPAPFGQKRFLELRSALEPSIEEIRDFAELIGTNSRTLLRLIYVICLDELLGAYAPSSLTKAEAEMNGEPIPVMFIPNKPHANGFLTYLVNTFLNIRGRKFPFTCFIFPHLTSGDVNPNLALEKLIAKWPFAYKPTLFADSAWGSFSNLEKIRIWGGFGVLSMGVNAIPASIQNALAWNLPTGHHRSIGKNNIILTMSTLKTTTNGIARKMIATNAVCGHQISTDPSQENVFATRRSDDVPIIPNYSLESLQQKKVEELKAICTEHNIKKGKVKAAFIDNIYRRSSTVHGAHAHLNHSLHCMLNHSVSDTSMIQDMYVSHFNLVDLSDRLYYAAADTHGSWRWKSKFLISTLKLGMVNVWAVANTFTETRYIDFRVNLALEILRTYTD